jgi:hypothetical protein
MTTFRGNNNVHLHKKVNLFHDYFGACQTWHDASVIVRHV